MALDRALSRQREAESRASLLAELATSAIPLLGDRCPVCEQRIDPSDVETHLRELIARGGEDLPSLEAATSDAQQDLSALDESFERLRAQRRELESALGHLEEVDADRRRWRQDCEALASDEPPLRAGTAEALATGDIEALTQLRTSTDHLVAVSEQLAALLGTSGLAEEVERQRYQVSTLRRPSAS